MFNATEFPFRTKRTVTLVAVLAILSAPFLARADEPVRIPQKMLKSFMSGTTVGMVSPKSGRTMAWHFRPDGTLGGELVDAMRGGTDEGKWWVSPTGTLCLQWQRWSEARRRCRILSVAGDALYGTQPATGERLSPDWKIEKLGPEAGAVVIALRGGASRPVVASRSPAAPRPPATPQPAVKSDRTPPSIDVPASLTTDGATIEISGKVEDASQVVEVSVNGRPIPVLPSGAFNVTRGVPVGASRVVVAAVDEWGNRSERNVDIRRRNVVVAARSPVSPPVSARPAGLDPFAGVHFGRYHAVVIGNDRYRHLQPLRSARNDAASVSRILAEEYGFAVTQLTDATRGEILGSLATMRATLKPDDNLLIYYAGHGVVDSVTEQGYWLPVDAEQQNPANWISNTDLTNMLRAIRARHVMVVADSCYSGTLVRAASAKLATARDKVKWVERMLGKRGRTALVSGGLEPVVDSGTGTDHSVFAQAFIAALKENREVLEGHALFDRIKRPVILNADQTPQYSDIRLAGHEGGEFIFVRRTVK